MCASGRRFIRPLPKSGTLLMTIMIYHNPACGTSRNVPTLIRNSDDEPRIIAFLKATFRVTAVPYGTAGPAARPAS